MKLLKKALLAMFIVVTALIIMPQMQTKVEAAVRISDTKKTMYKGYTYKLKVTGTNKKVKWSSSDKSKATVNSNGKVYVKKNGKVTITAKVGGKKYKCKVTIKNKPYNFTQFKNTFYDLKDVAKEYRDVKNIKNYKDFVYDLDGDGKKDTIRLKRMVKDEYGEETYELQYNGTAFFTEQVGVYDRVYVADLDKNDKTLEIVVKYTSVGEGIDYDVYQKNGKKIKKINSKCISASYISDIELKVDQNGKIVLDDTYLQHVSPKVFRRYYKLENGKVNTKKLDAGNLNNIKFNTKDKMLFITNMNNIDKYFDNNENAGIIEGNFKAFKILKFTDRGEFKVKLKNGTKGYLFSYAGFLAG